MEKEVVRVWFCNRRQKEKRISCPMPSPIKSPIYNSRLVRDSGLRSSTCHPRQKGNGGGGGRNAAGFAGKGQDISLYTQVPKLLASPLHSPVGDYTCRSVQRSSWASHVWGIYSTSQIEWNVTFAFTEHLFLVILMKTIERKYKFPRRYRSS